MKKLEKKWKQYKSPTIQVFLIFWHIFFQLLVDWHAKIAENSKLELRFNFEGLFRAPFLVLVTQFCIPCMLYSNLGLSTLSNYSRSNLVLLSPRLLSSILNCKCLCYTFFTFKDLFTLLYIIIFKVFVTLAVEKCPLTFSFHY